MKSQLLLGKHFPFDTIPDLEITTLTDHSEKTNEESIFVSYGSSHRGFIGIV